MQMRKMVMAVLLAAGLAAGCGTNPADSKNGTKTADGAQPADGTESKADTETAADKEQAAGTENASDSAAAGGTEEKTEIRREKYDDCDGSGHGYVEIYYSDGSMETEEY